MTLRTRRLLLPAVALLTLAGCKTGWCKKRDTAPSCPPAPPPGAPIITPGAPAPGGTGPTGEFLMPAPLPPSGAAGPVAPAPPPPTFPSGPSNFPPVASFYPPAAPPPTGALTAPPVRLLPPETAAPPAGLSESFSSPAAAAAPALPSGIPDFAAAIPDRVANGRKPTLDGLDWLKANGYKAALYLRPPGASDAADRKQFEQRGLAFASLEVSPATLSGATVAAFARAVRDPLTQPLFVYDADGSLAGGLWYLYFRQVERLSDEAARLRAGRLGLRDNEMAQAAQRLAQVQ
jgi:hypothetical protein